MPGQARAPSPSLHRTRETIHLSIPPFDIISQKDKEEIRYDQKLPDYNKKRGV